MLVKSMNDTSHLELLRQMFPERFVLDITEIAMVLGCSKQLLYVQSARKTLPFARLPGYRFRVTLVELARYLDASGAQPDASEVVKQSKEGFAAADQMQEVQGSPVAKKKVGRPKKINRILNH